MGYLESLIRRANGEIVQWKSNGNSFVVGQESGRGNDHAVRRENDNSSVGGSSNSGDIQGSERSGVGDNRSYINGGDSNRKVSDRVDDSGLNPNRVRGFGPRSVGSNVEPPSLNDMRAKQGAIVAKFMTFFKRRSTLVIEMYEACFYKNKPKFDQIANFIYKDLCPTDDLRRAVRDVQLHPVKMLIFVRFSEDKFRDCIASNICSNEGVMWSEYNVKVKGYSIDAEVKFIRLLGVSP